jgi:ubiquitin-conjugating enzyme E2 J2
MCLRRLRKDLKEFQTKPPDNIRACPKEDNILTWHYVIEGASDTPYFGGWFHGVIVFPKEFPMKPPSLQMYTPNGRFKPHTRLCLSMSDFHPESWNPMWSPSTILLGLSSFMLEEAVTYGSISSTDAYKRQCATESLAHNVKDRTFRELFPELVDIHKKKIEKNRLILQALAGTGSSGCLSPNQLGMPPSPLSAQGADEVNNPNPNPNNSGLAGIINNSLLGYFENFSAITIIVIVLVGLIIRAIGLG